MGKMLDWANSKSCIWAWVELSLYPTHIPVPLLPGSALLLCPGKGQGQLSCAHTPRAPSLTPMLSGPVLLCFLGDVQGLLFGLLQLEKGRTSLSSKAFWGNSPTLPRQGVESSFLVCLPCLNCLAADGNILMCLPPCPHHAENKASSLPFCLDCLYSSILLIHPAVGVYNYNNPLGWKNN